MRRCRYNRTELKFSLCGKGTEQNSFIQNNIAQAVLSECKRVTEQVTTVPDAGSGSETDSRAETLGLAVSCKPKGHLGIMRQKCHFMLQVNIIRKRKSAAQAEPCSNTSQVTRVY